MANLKIGARGRTANRATSVGSPSLILDLHRRYEEIWDAHNRVDEAQPPKSDDAAHKEYYACERAMGELADESELVSRLLLRQIPKSDEEVAVIALHLSSMYESQQDLPVPDQKAIEIGIAQVFDYLMGEGRADMERLGRLATNATLLRWDQRRYREGVLEFEDENRPG